MPADFGMTTSWSERVMEVIPDTTCITMVPTTPLSGLTAVITVEPDFSPVMVMESAFVDAIDATEGSELVHLSTVPDTLGVISALIVIFSPTFTWSSFAVSFMALTDATTFIVHCARFVTPLPTLICAVTVVVPTFLAVTKPVSSTLAMESSLLIQYISP